MSAIATYPARYVAFHTLPVGAVFDVVYPPAEHGDKDSIASHWHKVRLMVVVAASRPGAEPRRMYQEVQGKDKKPMKRVLTDEEITEWEGK